MKKLALLVLLAAAMASLASAEGFEKGKSYIGPSIGIGWGMGFGGQYEYGINEKFGAGADLAYTSFTDEFVGYKWKYTLIGFLAAGSYHFTPGKQFDPYAKLGLGFFNWDAEYSDPYGHSSSSLYTAGYSSGIGFAGQLGARYFFSPTVAGRAALGWPFYFSAGVDFKF